MLRVSDIRAEFLQKYNSKTIVSNDTGSLSGSKAIEILGASFLADEPAIFGTPNKEYIKRELEWYLSQSLFVDEMPGKTPAIWKAVASNTGTINSNYGYLVFNADNGSQATNVIKTLRESQTSRRATMIYTRPSMHDDYCEDGMSDFVCTNAVQYIIRDKKLHVIVQMRSNDAIFGYANDYAWQKYMQEFVCSQIDDEKLRCGDIIWQVSSLHIYEKHFYYMRDYVS